MQPAVGHAHGMEESQYGDSAQALDIETLKVAPIPANPPVNDLGDTHILFHIGIESGDYFMSLIG